MSYSLYLYTVRGVERPEELPEIIEQETYNKKYHYVYNKSAEEWEKQIGTKRILKYQAIKWFDAIQDITGHQVRQFSYLYDGSIQFEVEDGNSNRRTICITPEQLAPYRYTETEYCWFYDLSLVFTLEECYMLDYEPYRNRFLQEADFYKWIEEYVGKYPLTDNIYEYEMKPVWMMLMGIKALRQGHQVVCITG